MANPYSDAPLSRHEGSQEFRLVELQPSEPSEPIKCILHTHAFDSHPPGYTALSYTWGPKVKPRVIELNGVLFPVGQSLWSFLEQMRLQEQFCVYWIDAICIDQDSVLERNHQVQMMRQIYSNAVSVSVWLGEVDKELTSDIAMEHLETEFGATYENFVSYAKRDPTNCSRSPSQQTAWQEAVESMLGVQQIEAIVKLCNRPYWSRIWIVQEACLAPKLTVFCGSKRVDWLAFENLDHFVRSFGPVCWGHTRRGISYSKTMQLVRARGVYESSKGFTSLIPFFLWFDDYAATNTLDRVYGVCGLLRGGVDFTIDYDISPEDLLIVILRHICVCEPGVKAEALEDFAWRMSEALGVNSPFPEGYAQAALAGRRYQVQTID